MSLVSASSVQKMERTLRDQRAQVLRATEARIKKEYEVRASAEHIGLAFIVAAILISIGIHLRVDTLKYRFQRAYKWWASPTGYNNLKFPPAQGTAKITIPSAAVSAAFPLLARMGGLLFMESPLNEQAALFLLDVVGTFGFSRNLAAVHFNGSMQQLRYSDLDSFLPTGNGAWTKSGKTYVPNWSYIWISFIAMSADGTSANPWFNTFWTTLTEFKSAPVISDYYADPPKRNFMQSLYRGGLCEVAQTVIDDKTSARELITMMVGERMREVPLPCTHDQKAQAGVQSASTATGLAMMPAMMAQAAVPGIGAVAAVAMSLGAGAAWGAHAAATTVSCGYTLAPQGTGSA